MAWFWYKRGGWEIAVDAVSRRDADNLISIHAMGAKFTGEHAPPTGAKAQYSTATAMTTEKRQAEISNANKNPGD